MVSSELSAQIFSKQFAWSILCDRDIKETRHTPPKEFRLEVWWKRVWVCLPQSLINPGFSTFLSYWDFIDAFWTRSYSKSYECQAFLEKKIPFNRGQILTVTSYSSEKSYRVTLHKVGANCTCMLFRCLNNRIKHECYEYYQLMKESRFFAGQPVCHHIYAALQKLGYGCLADYLGIND